MTISILITGANQGLGLETGRQLAKVDGVRLILSGRSEEKIKEAVKTLKAEKGIKADIDYVVIDLASDASIFAAAKVVETKLGDGRPLDVLVNNAGVFIDYHYPDAKDQRKLWSETYNTNVFGTAVIIGAFAPLLKRSKEARIISLGSGLGSLNLMADKESAWKQFFIDTIAYSSSKSALQALTIATAHKYPEIHSVVINPGYNATAMNEYKGTTSPEDGVKIVVKHALSRVGVSPGFYQEEGELPW